MWIIVSRIKLINNTTLIVCCALFTEAIESKITSIPFIKPPQVFHITSRSAVYNDDSLGLCISAPEGSLEAGEELKVHIGLTLHGSFEKPSTSLISPILMVHTYDKVQLKHPLTVKLPIILSQVSDKDVKRYGVHIKKSTDASVSSSGLISFKDIEEDVYFNLYSKEGRSYAVFSISHFCFISLHMRPELKDSAAKLGCCICPLIPSQEAIISGTFSFYLCVTYYMEPCIQVCI